MKVIVKGPEISGPDLTSLKIDKSFVHEQLKAMCLETAQKLKELIGNGFHAGMVSISPNEWSDNALVLYPELRGATRDLSSLEQFIQAYLDTILINEYDNRVVVEHDDREMLRSGISSNLPLDLEYGSAETPTVPHWRTAIQELENNVIFTLAQDLLKRIEDVTIRKIGT